MRCFLISYWFPNRIIIPFEVRNVVGKDAFCISRSAALSLLLAWLNNRKLCGVWVLCQVDLAFGFKATNLLISLGMLLVGRWEFLAGVASLAACCITPMKMSVANFTSSRSLSFTASFTLLFTSFLKVSHFVCELCSRGGGCRTVTDMLMVVIIGVWFEVRS